MSGALVTKESFKGEEELCLRSDDSRDVEEQVTEGVRGVIWRQRPSEARLCGQAGRNYLSVNTSRTKGRDHWELG